MRAMILAAGRGERMGALTAELPKPLLAVGGRFLIDYAILQCKAANITDIVINVAYHGDKIMAAIGDGSRYGVNITYSIEAERLETGGGIVKALPMLGDAPFLVLSADVITDYPLQQLPHTLSGLAHLVLVPNPSFHPRGDFGLQQGLVVRDGLPTYTFGNVSVLHPALFEGLPVTHFPLNHVLSKAIAQQKITGEIYEGPWYNVGDPVQLAAISALTTSDVTPLR